MGPLTKHGVGKLLAAAYAFEIYGLYLCRFAFFSCNELLYGGRRRLNFKLFPCNLFCNRDRFCVPLHSTFETRSSGSFLSADVTVKVIVRLLD